MALPPLVGKLCKKREKCGSISSSLESQKCKRDRERERKTQPPPLGPRGGRFTSSGPANVQLLGRQPVPLADIWIGLLIYFFSKSELGPEREPDAIRRPGWELEMETATTSAPWSSGQVNSPTLGFRFPRRPRQEGLAFASQCLFQGKWFRILCLGPPRPPHSPFAEGPSWLWTPTVQEQMLLTILTTIRVTGLSLTLAYSSPSQICRL